MTPKQLRNELDKRGLSQTEAARVLGIDRTYLWMLLQGRRNITRDRADLIRMRLAEYDATDS